MSLGDATAFAVDGSFVFRCFSLYWGDGAVIPVLFAAALIWILARRRKSSAVMLLYVTLLLGLTIYNPLVIRLIVPGVMEKEIYYRTFWLLPIIPGTAYLVVDGLSALKSKGLRAGLAALLLALTAVTGQINTNVSALSFPENIYKVPDAVIWASEEIHKDFKTSKKEIRAYYKAHSNSKKKTPKRPCAVFANDLTGYVRQYDPKLNLGIRRNTRLLYYGSTVVNGDLSQPQYRRAMVILNQLNGRGSVGVEEFREALTAKKITYIVVHDYSAQGTFLTACGLELIAENYGYEIYRFIPKEEYMTEYALWSASQDAGAKTAEETDTEAQPEETETVQ